MANAVDIAAEENVLKVRLESKLHLDAKQSMKNQYLKSFKSSDGETQASTNLKQTRSIIKVNSCNAVFSTQTCCSFIDEL